MPWNYQGLLSLIVFAFLLAAQFWDHNLVRKFHNGQTRLWFLCTKEAKLVICLHYSLFTLQVVGIDLIFFSSNYSIS